MIFLDDIQDKFDIDEEFYEKLKEVILFALKEEEVDKECEISLLLVDNSKIKEINEETRGIDKATDVLSFPMLDYENGKVYKDIYKGYDFDLTYYDGEYVVLGDIVLSLERAKEQSIEYNHSFFRECSYLVVHSVLHLLGYDHMEEEEKKVMRDREEAILNKLNITRND